MSASWPPNSRRVELSEEDLAACVAYIDGAMSTEQQLEFERRLAARPELASRVRQLLETDELLRGAGRDAPREIERARRLVPWVWAVSCAAAAAVLVWAVIHLATPRETALFEATLSASHEGAREWVEAHERLAGLSTAGLENLRGGAATANVAPERFVELASEAERSELLEALAAPPLAALEAGYFVIPLRLAAPAEVAVFALSSTARVERIFQADTLAAGEHVLPGPRFALTGEGTALRVRFQRGFLTPVGIRDLELVIAVRRAGAAGAAFDGSGASDRATLDAALRAQGYQTRSFTVREPR